MDYLQYQEIGFSWKLLERSFKPYYKWITFNTIKALLLMTVNRMQGFKPYYKWITFNTDYEFLDYVWEEVLNLIINGLPSIPLPKG